MMNNQIKRQVALSLFTLLLSICTMAQGVMDVHSHIITPGFVAALEQESRLMEEGFPLPKYDVESHLRWMDEAGVETSVLTLAAPQPKSADGVRATNEEAARIKREHPGRFMFCAALPLPDVEAAIREVVYALDTLGADGIKLATNVKGQYLGAPELDTLFAVLNERHAVVIQHAVQQRPGRGLQRAVGHPGFRQAAALLQLLHPVDRHFVVLVAEVF